MREQFEKLPEICEIMNSHGIHFMNHSGFYEAAEFKDFEYEQYVNGAWYAYQEQQKKIDGALYLACKHQYSNGERIYNEIKELLK